MKNRYSSNETNLFQRIEYGFIKGIALILGVVFLIIGKDNGMYWVGVVTLIVRDILIEWINYLPMNNT